MSSKSTNAASTSDREIAITRVIPAPRQLVFAAFTDRAHISNWWGPEGFSTTTREMDVRPGGQWLFTMHGADGTDYPNRVVYREVTKPSRLVYDHSGEGHKDDHSFQVTVTFDEREGKTFVTFRLLAATVAQRENLVKFGAVEGGHQTLERFEQHITELIAGGDGASQPNTQSDADNPVFEITRVFDAPRHLVWRAHSEAGHLQHWWGPKGCKLDVAKLEFRPGGMFHYAMRYSTGAEMWGRFFYREIVPQRRIVWLNSFANAGGGIARAPFSPDCPLEMLNIATFTEHDGKTTLAQSASPFGGNEAERKFFADLFPSLKQGFGGTYDQLDEYLKKTRGS